MRGEKKAGVGLSLVASGGLSGCLQCSAPGTCPVAVCYSACKASLARCGGCARRAWANFLRDPVVRAWREMSLVAVSRFFRLGTQMSFPAVAGSHPTPPQRAVG